MAQPVARTPQQSRALDRKVNALSIQGLNARQISERLLDDEGIRIGRRGVQARIDRLNAASQEEREELITREIRAIDWTQAEAMTGWEKSKLPAEVSYAETTGGGPKQGGKDKSSIKTIGQTGDPRFLQVIVKCSERRARLRGLDAPTGVDLTTKPGMGVLIYHPDEDPIPGSNGDPVEASRN